MMKFKAIVTVTVLAEDGTVLNTSADTVNKLVVGTEPGETVADVTQYMAEQCNELCAAACYAVGESWD